MSYRLRDGLLALMDRDSPGTIALSRSTLTASASLGAHARRASRKSRRGLGRRRGTRLLGGKRLVKRGDDSLHRGHHRALLGGDAHTRLPTMSPSRYAAAVALAERPIECSW
jgi:hypothetical protein